MLTSTPHRITATMSADSTIAMGLNTEPPGALTQQLSSSGHAHPFMLSQNASLSDHERTTPAPLIPYYSSVSR